MTLGVNGNGQTWKEAALTFCIVFVINFLLMLPKGVMPSQLELYNAFIQSALTALSIYALDKGIHYTKKEETT